MTDTRMRELELAARTTPRASAAVIPYLAACWRAGVLFVLPSDPEGGLHMVQFRKAEHEGSALRSHKYGWPDTGERATTRGAGVWWTFLVGGKRNDLRAAWWIGSAGRLYLVPCHGPRPPFASRRRGPQPGNWTFHDQVVLPFDTPDEVLDFLAPRLEEWRPARRETGVRA